MHDWVKSFYLFILILGLFHRSYSHASQSHHLNFSTAFLRVFSAQLSRCYGLSSSSLHCTYIFPPSPLPSLRPHLLPPGWKAILVVDWRMMLLLRESLHQHRGRRGERKEREKSSGGVVAPWGAVAVMGELSNAPLSKLPSKHHVTTRD